MQKKILLVVAIIMLLFCAFAVTVSAEEIDPHAEYYDKVYTDLSGREFPIYEKVGDTYYPLVWFDYDVKGVDEVTGEEIIIETKYVKAHFEDCDVYSEEPGQGRFNGVRYDYTDENGNTMVLDTSNAVVINLRGGVMTRAIKSNGSVGGTNLTIKTIETYKPGYPWIDRLEAIYFPLTQTAVGTLTSSKIRVADIDKNHPIRISIGHKAFAGSGIVEVFIPGKAVIEGNSTFQGCTKLEKVVFGKDFSSNFPNYCFDRCSSLKLVCFMDSEEKLNNIQVGTASNGYYTSMTKISSTEYSALTDKSGKYIVYDCSPCVAFNNDVHTESDNMILVGNDFFSPISITCACAIEGCGVKIAVGEIGSIVTSKGYSATTFGEKLSVAQGFFINQDALTMYRSYVGDVEIGVLATVNTVGEEFTPNFEAEKVIVAQLNSLIHDYVDVKITGISEAQADSLIVFCMYISVDEKTYFLDGGATDNTVLGRSYNSII